MHCNLKTARYLVSCSELFWPNLYCTCAETAIFQHSDFAIRFSDPKFLKRAIIWRSDDATFSVLFFDVQIKNRPDFYFRAIWPNNLEHVLHVALSTAYMYTDDFLQVWIYSTRSWLVMFLLPIPYVIMWTWPLTLWPWTLWVYRLSRYQTLYHISAHQPTEFQQNWTMFRWVINDTTYHPARFS